MLQTFNQGQRYFTDVLTWTDEMQKDVELQDSKLETLLSACVSLQVEGTKQKPPGC